MFYLSAPKDLDYVVGIDYLFDEVNVVGENFPISHEKIVKCDGC